MLPLIIDQKALNYRVTGTRQVEAQRNKERTRMAGESEQEYEKVKKTKSNTNND